MKSGKEENAEGATDEQEWQKSRGNQETCQGTVKAWYEGAQGGGKSLQRQAVHGDR